MKSSAGKGKILSSNHFPVVGIGASAGGLDAFKKLVRAIPEDSGMAYVLVQHLDPNHESLLSDILRKVTAIPVLVVSDDIRVEPDHIYILPSNKMLVANDGVLLLSPRQDKSNKLRNLPIDLFFTSLAEVHQAHSIGVVLSGTASDGTAGLKSIKEHGGITFAQDEVSAAFDSMPLSAMQAGVVDFILSPDQIPQKILEVLHERKEHNEASQTTPPRDDAPFKSILSLLRMRKGTDFTYYKQTTIRRRILRRMALHKNKEPSSYFKYVRENKSEQDVLYQDLLISVTSFFRDPKSYDSLCTKVFPLITKDKNVHEPIRIWVAACSTGEEAYSLAICFKEFLGEHPGKIQIFATDISEPAIVKARLGLYSQSEVTGLTPKQLNDFFTETGGHFHIHKSIRDMCVFAKHNFLQDPPFGKMDLISCRNVLIYMEPYLQKRALTTFHYALSPKGFLLLGKSETINSVPYLFTSMGKNDKLFIRKDVPSKLMHVARGQREQNTVDLHINPKNEVKHTDFRKAADELMLSRYTPAGVVVNEEMDIVHFRGNTGNYLEQGPGKPSHNLLKMAKKGLAFELRNIFHKVKKEKDSVIKENISFQLNDRLRNISIEAIPLTGVIETHYLILFHDHPSLSVIPESAKPSSQTAKDEKDIRIQQLEKELEQMHEDMHSIAEDQEAANEELQSANEELLSSSEELQSLNEELETSKEELQSTNEELITVNQELIGLNELVTEGRNYAEAIVTTVREPLVVLDKSLRIKTANSSFYRTFHTTKLETENKLIYDIGNEQWNLPALRVLLETLLPEKESFFDFEVEHHFQSIGQRTMLLNARQIIKPEGAENLILLAIEDITERKKIEDVLKKSEAMFHRMADLMPEKIATVDGKGNLVYYNQKWLDYTGIGLEELKTYGWWKFMHPDEVEYVRKCWLDSIGTGNDFELEHRFLNKDNEYQWHLSRGVGVRDDHGKIDLWIGSSTLIQKQKEQSEQLEKTVVSRTNQLQKASETLYHKNVELGKMNEELRSFSYVASHDLQEPLRKIQTFSKRILDSEDHGLTDKGKDYFDRIQKAAQRMQTLIEDLLAFSRISTAERKFVNIDLNQIVAEVIDELKDTIEEKHATLEIKELCSAYIIPFQFRQLMLNLIGNSLKFSKSEPPPHIIIESANIIASKANIHDLTPGTEYCHISVKDNGIGFKQEYKEKIFDLFQRLHGKDHYDGTGIGLSIVKKIVENHNGYIHATSAPNEGTTFDIYISVEPKA